MTANIELAKRAVVSPGFRHIDGMQWIHIDALKNGRNAGWDKSRGSSTSSAEEFRAYGWLPNLDDWGTLGCIEHGLLPELYGCEVSVCFWHDTWWLVRHNDSHTMRSLGWPKCKAEALVAALEAAPAKAVQG